jgi:hypothetical protein
MSPSTLHWPARRHLFRHTNHSQRGSLWWTTAVLVVALVGAGVSVALA